MMGRLCIAATCLILFGGCSVTSRLAEGEILYTGIDKIEITPTEGRALSRETEDEVSATLEYAPNNSLFGSSYKQMPFPLGLWIYNGFAKYTKGPGRWFFNRFAARPVLLSTVDPSTRAAVARNILRERGYFNAGTSFSIIPHTKDSLRAKVSYHLTPGLPYTYDSIRYVRFRHRADTLIKESMDETFLKKGAPFDVIALENERRRISELLRNNGFYYYRPDMIVYRADTLLSPQKVHLRVTRKGNIPSSALRPWRTGDITIDLLPSDGAPLIDSLRYKGINIRYRGKPGIRLEALYRRIRLKPGERYSQQAEERTQSGLSRLDVFRYTRMHWWPADTTARNNRLNVRIEAMYDLPIDAGLELNLTGKSNRLAGPGVVLGLTKRNLLGAGERLEMELKGSYEWFIGGQNQAQRSQRNSYETELSGTLRLPFLLFPGEVYRDRQSARSTSFRLYAGSMNRAQFFRMLSLGGTVAYNFGGPSYLSHRVEPFRLSYHRLQGTTAAFDSITKSNPALLQSLEDQFTPAMSWSVIYNRPSPGMQGHDVMADLSFTQAGNLLSVLHALSGQGFNQKGKKLLGIPFSQFIKAVAEFRYNYRLDRNNRLAGRILAGAIYSYGNSLVTPYSEQFYAGGANSLRAFAVRSAGPGRFVPAKENKYAYLEQTGDVKLEANLEYRFLLAGSLYGAAFMDWGNVWLLRSDPNRPGGTLRADRLLSDMALGTGAGVRLDLSFLVIRIDAGFPLHLPYPTSHSGYFNHPRKVWRNTTLHFAVGYPF